MKYVKQSRFGEDGDCLRAGVASILGVPLDKVPDLLANWEGKDGWLEHVNLLLRPLQRALAYVATDVENPPAGLSLQYGKGPAHAHVVVCWCGDPVWDPHPYRAAGRLAPHYGWLKLVTLFEP